jgi:acetylornithine/succinyldiaminopimelate/putrescine aminotransferase
MRGAGYMVGLSLKEEGLNLKIAAAAREKGLLIVPAGHNTVRMLPALTATSKQLSEAVAVLDEVFSELTN